MQTLIETITVCAHCTLPVPSGLIRAGEDEQFCCPGCRAVYDQIHACGLEDYYRFRDAGEVKPEPAAQARLDTAAFDSAAYAELYVRSANGQHETEFVLEGITCAACVWLVEQLPQRLPGLIEARLNITDNTVRLRWTNAIHLSQIAGELLRFGYRPHPARGIVQADLDRRELRKRLVDLAVAGAIAGNLMLLAAALYAGWVSGIDRSYEQLLRWISLPLGVLSLAWPGRTFFRGAWTAIRLRTVNFDLPIAIALTAGGVAGVVSVVLDRGDFYFDSLSALIFLLLVGRLLQFWQQRRARAAVELLFSLSPSTCRVIRDGRPESLPIQALQMDDVVEVLGDELFPADGVVESGLSAVNTALLTGEAQPIRVGPGDPVFGGAQNIKSALRVRVTAVGQHSRVGRLMRLLEQGLADKPPIVQLTDRVAARFTLAVVTAAVVTFAWWLQHGLSSAIDVVVALLIVTCPCVLGLAVPLSFALSIGRLARRGILVKSACAIERLARGGTLVLDKTGTLTTGRLDVVTWHGETIWQGVAARIEHDSVHPVGQALRRAYEAMEPPSSLHVRRDSIQVLAGGICSEVGGRQVLIGSPRLMNVEGVECPAALYKASVTDRASGRTVVMVAVDGQVRAVVTLGDSIRPDAASTLAALRERGYDPELCSGDGQYAVDAVANALQLKRAQGNVSPEEKLASIKARHVVMVGDGVNDAAALAAADVGIAVAGGAEAALAAADVYLARPGLSGLVELVETAHHTLAIVHRNVVVASLYNVLAGALAISGQMHPLMAAVLMPMSSVTVLILTILAARRGPKASPQ